MQKGRSIAKNPIRIISDSASFGRVGASDKTMDKTAKLCYDSVWFFYDATGGIFL